MTVESLDLSVPWGEREGGRGREGGREGEGGRGIFQDIMRHAVMWIYLQ